MYQKIIVIFLTKVYSAAISLLLLVITSRIFGAEGRGEISLFIANLALIQIFNELVNGSSMIYLVPRTNTFSLFLSSILWSLVCGLLVTGILYFTNICPADHFIYLYLLSISYSIFSASSRILLGKEEIRKNNILSFIQVTLLVVSLFVLIWLNGSVVFNYIYALHISYLVAAILGILFLSKYFIKKEDSLFAGFSDLIKTGAKAQVSNFLDFFTYRVYYYLILFHYSWDKKMLGIFSTALMISESVWLISNSIANYQYPSISNKQDLSHAYELTRKLSRISFYLAVGIILVILLIPQDFYQWIFGKDFSGIKTIILLSSVGVISISVSKIYWNYFSGLGKFHINNISGLIGIVSAAGAGILLIQGYSINGTAVAYSIACTLATLYHFYAFIKVSKMPLNQSFPF